MSDIQNEFELKSRSGLPDALRVLVKEYPVNIWESHENFDGLVRFWLDRHIMFRKLMSMMQEDLRAAISKQMELHQYQQRLARLGSIFVGELHTHHSIEDYQYFPKLKSLDHRIESGFDILDADHHALDHNLSLLTDVANLILQPSVTLRLEHVSELERNLSNLDRLLDRHLLDEEELIVPVILKHGFRG